MKNYYLQFSHQDWIRIDDLQVPPLLLERMADLGIVEPQSNRLSLEEAEKVKRILRIRSSLGVNLSGAAIIVELLERLELIEQQIDQRRKEK